MIQFTKPENLNGAELLAELKAGGVTINDFPMVENGNFWLEIAEADKAKATSIVAAHNGTMIAPNNLAAKTALLSKLGITEDEARLLLS